MEVAPNRPSRLPEKIAKAISGRATVVTMSQRAAHELRRAFNEDMRQRGELQWTPPEIFALDSWLVQIWARMTTAGATHLLLLNHTQELSLWRRILAADPETPVLRSLDSLAAMAALTWHQLCAYKGRSRMHEASASTDSKAFLRWARGFEQALERSNFLTSAQLPAALLASLSRGDLPLPDAGLLLVDFDVTTPALADLFDSIRNAGYNVSQLQTTAAALTSGAFAAPDERTELETSAHWIRHALEDDPSLRIAVVFPDLAGRRAEIARIFGHALAPELERIASSEAAETGPFEFSLGQPLAETPMVAIAQDQLRWTLEPLSLATVSELLLSPFFGSAPSSTDHLAVAEFDATELRQQQLLRPKVSLEAVIRLLESSPRRRQLASLLHKLRSLHRAAADKLTKPQQRSHAEWSDIFRNVLEASGWTQTANSGSLAFQTQRKFESALDEFATLDFEGSCPSAASALDSLTRITSRILFAPESRGAPVQIMGPLEVGGVPFDALWFLGAGDLGWPQAFSPSPLLPWQLQRSLGIPGSDASRDHASAAALTARISNSATRTVFSFARDTEQGEQRISPLLSELNLEPFPEREQTFSPERLQLEVFLDQAPMSALPDHITPGGAQVLQAQAACSFRAFAEHRLSSSDPVVRSPGLDAMERGSLVHRVMEYFWTKIGSQSELRALPPLERQFLLEESINVALERPLRASETPWDTAYLQTERQRLHRLLEPWLQQEMIRPEFTVRHREEQVRDAKLGPLRLSLRVDRIDDTAAGPVIIDYKTGSANPNDWLGERPDAPQLPLYGVLSAEPVAGIAFGLLRAGKDLALKGFADSTQAFGPVANKKIRMSEQLEEWRQNLTSLAIAFDVGDAVPDPKTYPRTCLYCRQRLICRLDPTTLRPQEDEEEMYGEEEIPLG